MRRIQDLRAGNYEVKIIDYGIACELQHGSFKSEQCGTLELAAPEVFESKYDHRVDVWGVGLIAYMLYHSDYMFEDIEQTEWCLSNLNCSIEFIKFIQEVVQSDMNNRPFPDQLKINPYFSVDLSSVQTISQYMPWMHKGLACLKSKSGQVYSEYDPQLWFYSNWSHNFD